jgi:hypothetical protein
MDRDGVTVLISVACVSGIAHTLSIIVLNATMCVWSTSRCGKTGDSQKVTETRRLAVVTSPSALIWVVIALFIYTTTFLGWNAVLSVIKKSRLTLTGAVRGYCAVVGGVRISAGIGAARAVVTVLLILTTFGRAKILASPRERVVNRLCTCGCEGVK